MGELNCARQSRDRVSLRRVVLVSNTYPPVLGGSESEAQRVSAALIRRGHSIVVVCAAEEPMPRKARWVDPFGVPVRIVGVGWPAPLRSYIFAAGVAWMLFRERNRYDLVYFLMQGLHLASGLPMARLLRKPVVMKISGSGLIQAMTASWLGRLELKWLRRWAKRVMILNDGMVAEALAAGLSQEQLLWMPNPTEVEEFRPLEDDARRRLREQRGLRGVTTVFAGRLAPEKELASLIGAFARAILGQPDAELILIGDGPCRSELMAKARALGIEAHVRFTGRATAEQVREWLQASDVFALVSSLEGFPLSLAEAMSVGLPVVVSDIPGNRQLVNQDVHGFLAPVKDEEALAACLRRLFADASLRARMGREARRRIVENYSTDHVAQRYESLLEEVLGEPEGVREAGVA
jgi:glycosyltransferase involved in cell wall biosynthesis